MKQIIALIDFSDVAFAVLKLAHKLALAMNSHVTILHVVPPEPVVVDFGPASPTLLETPKTATLDAHLARLRELRDSLISAGVNATEMQIQGSTVDQILARTKELQADLIILGSHGHGALYNLIVGSVTHDVIRHAPCPVLVVPAGE